MNKYLVNKLSSKLNLYNLPNTYKLSEKLLSDNFIGDGIYEICYKSNLPDFIKKLPNNIKVTKRGDNYIITTIDNNGGEIFKNVILVTDNRIGYFKI